MESALDVGFQEMVGPAEHPGYSIPISKRHNTVVEEELANHFEDLASEEGLGSPTYLQPWPRRPTPPTSANLRLCSPAFCAPPRTCGQVR